MVGCHMACNKLQENYVKMWKILLAMYSPHLLRIIKAYGTNLQFHTIQPIAYHNIQFNVMQWNLSFGVIVDFTTPPHTLNFVRTRENNITMNMNIKRHGHLQELNPPTQHLMLAVNDSHILAQEYTTMTLGEI